MHCPRWDEGEGVKGEGNKSSAQPQMLAMMYATARV